MIKVVATSSGFCVIGQCVGAHTELTLLLKHRLDSCHNSSYLGESLHTGTGTVTRGVGGGVDVMGIR